MIKCIATDMDGTLLNSTAKKITDENREAIKKAQSVGVEVVIATGRAYDEVSYLLQEAELKCPVIGVNGAEIRTKEGEVVSTFPLTKQDALAASSKLLDHEIYFEVYTNKGKFTHDREKSMSIILDIIMSANPNTNYDETVHFAKARAAKIKQINDYNELFENQQIKIYKFLAFSFDSESLAKASESLNEMENTVVSSSGHGNLEITHKSAQKGIALERFVRENKMSLSETMAIGDSFNDVSMFERVGRSVAMGNAEDLIKAQCDFVTDSNDENGVAKAIWKVLKKNTEYSLKS